MTMTNVDHLDNNVIAKLERKKIKLYNIFDLYTANPFHSD